LGFVFLTLVFRKTNFKRSKNMWTWIIILLVAAGGLAIWMGAKKDKEDEGASAPEAPEVVDAAPTVEETPAPIEGEDSGDEEKPMSM